MQDVEDREVSMGSVLPLVGIAALMVLGFVIWVTALTYEAPVKSDTPRDRALARERRRLHRKQRRKRAQQATSVGLRSVRASAVELGAWAIALAHKWWPRLRHHARQSRARWLSIESTTGPLIAVGAASVIVAYLVVTFA